LKRERKSSSNDHHYFGMQLCSGNDGSRADSDGKKECLREEGLQVVVAFLPSFLQEKR